MPNVNVSFRVRWAPLLFFAGVLSIFSEWLIGKCVVLKVD